MDVAPVIAMNFMRYNKFFLYFSGLSRGSEPFGSVTAPPLPITHLVPFHVIILLLCFYLDYGPLVCHRMFG